MKTSVVVLAVALSATSLAACGAGGVRHGQPYAGTTTVGDVKPVAPETLSEATAAAQADVDHFSAGDFADVWKHMSHAVRDRISQNDFVSFYRTCKSPGSKILVFGSSLDPGSNEAVVRMIVHGADRTRVMVYENGEWAMEPTGDFASHLGEPVEQIVAEEKAAGHCAH